MTTRTRRRRTAVPALALATLATLAAVAACASADQVSPLPYTAGTASPSVASPTAAASPGATAKQVPVGVPPTTRPPTGPACVGAVVHRVDASDSGPPWKPLCITVGGVLLVTNLGPEGFSASSWDDVECNYEAAVRECRLLHAGTVTFTIVNAHGTRTLALRIAEAAFPPKPSPACMADGTTLTIDAADGGPGRWPVCMKTSGVVRVVNLGPDGFLANPAGAVACSYEAAVRECRFTGPETVTFTTTYGDGMPRTQTVVAIR
jgi:hypothetical protein